jgi:transcription elongation factor Elf1
MEEHIVKKLMTSVKCTNCGQNYELPNINILAHHHGLWFFSVTCSSCHSQFLIAATISNEKVEVTSDLTEAETDRFKNASVPTADDVLDMYSYLEKFDGNFIRLFKYERV